MADSCRSEAKKPKLTRQSKLTEHMPKNMDELIFKRKEKHLLVKRLSTQAKIPTKKTDGAAGFDLIAPTPVYVPPLAARSVGTKIAIQIPKGYCGKIEGRSGLAKFHKVAVLGGVIDSDYRGEIEVLLMNLGRYPLDLPEHSRIAQLLIQKMHNAYELDEVEELDETKRNVSGFGSTGMSP